MGYQSVGGPILKVLTAHANEHVSVEHISAETGFDHVQIQHAIRGLIKRGLPIIVHGRARVWEYRPADTDKPAMAQPTVGSLMEVMGVTQQGTVLVRDENGIIYRALHLDV